MDDPMILESQLPYPKTLDKTVLVARAQETQEVLPGNAVQEIVVDAASGYMEVTERGGMEAETGCAQDQGPTSVTKPYGKGRVIEQQHEGSDNSLPLDSPAGGIDGGAKGKAGGQKKRKKRSKNWSDEETEILLKAVPKKKQFKNRFDKRPGSEPSWEGIAKEVQGRRGDECRMRMDTLTKSYNAIKELCDTQNKEFRQLNEEDFGNMRPAKLKLATRFTESWYNYIRDYCPPRSNKKVKTHGAGSLLEKGVDLVSCASTSGRRSRNAIATSVSIGTLGERGSLRAEPYNPDAESKILMLTTPDQVKQSEPALEAFEVVTLPDPIDVTHVETSWDGPPPAVDEPHPASPGYLLHPWGAEDGAPEFEERHQVPTCDLVPTVVDNTSNVPWTDAQDVPAVEDLFDVEALFGGDDLPSFEALLME